MTRRDSDRRGNGRRDDFKKEVVAMIVLIKTDVTVIKTIKNHAILQAKSKQALLFVTRAINKKKRFKVNRFYIRRPNGKER